MTRLLVAAIVLLAACVPPNASAPPATATAPATPSTALVAGTCEYLGARFTLPPAFTAKETREVGDPLARVTIDGELPGRHHVLLDVIARAVADYGGNPMPSALARRYFDAVRTAPFAAPWKDIREGQYPGPKRTYPALVAVEPFTSAGIAAQSDHSVLLLVSEDVARTQYFYSFFWTDTHLALDPRAPVTELEKLVDGFVVLASPVGAPSRGCAK